MKKRFIYIFIFIISLFAFNNKIEAKVVENDAVKVTFGDDDTLNLGYQVYNEYTVRNNEFYYNGELYTLTKEEIATGIKKIGDDTLKYYSDGNHQTLIGDKYHDFYSFNVGVEVKNSKTYYFEQKLCFKYNGISKCNQDKQDKTDVNRNKNGIRTFFYSFLPFYDSNIKFEEIYFEFKFTNIDNESDTFTFQKVGFDSTKDTINYTDYLNSTIVNWQDGYRVYNSSNNGKEYIGDYCINFDRNNLLNGISRCNNSISMTINNNFLYNVPNNILDSFKYRNYKIDYEFYVGKDYLTKINTSDYSINQLVLVEVQGPFGITRNVYQKTTYNSSLKTGFNSVVYFDLPFLGYNKENRTAKYDSFKMVTTYSCIADSNSDCSDPRSVNDNKKEQIIYLNLDEFKDNSTLLNGEKIELDNYDSYISSSSKLEYKISVSDNNGIDEVSYLISDNSLLEPFVDPYRLFSQYEFTKVKNNETINIDFSTPGSKFIYLKVKDGSGRIDYSLSNRELSFDNEPPKMTSNNFKQFDINGAFNTVEFRVSMSDMLNLQGKYKIEGYYLIVSENNKNPINKDDVINANNVIKDYSIDQRIYTGKVLLNKDNVIDGKYVVYFVFKDYLGNFSDLIKTDLIEIDNTPLSKQEVTSDIIEGYTNIPDIKISIDKVENGVSFKCDLFKKDNILISDITGTCFNNETKRFDIKDEGIYYLWIYASDRAGNLSLIKLDNPYYIDTLAPRIVTSVSKGDNKVYSNNVEIKVEGEDINGLDLTSLAYQFYLFSYDENNFVYFDLNKPITYPYNYYGEYKLAIKASDNLANTNINTFDVTYLIDTGIIKIDLNGKDTITILRYQNFNDPGVKVSKGNNHVNNINYSKTTNLNINKPGEYYITYFAGEEINKVEVTRKVIVKDSLPYIYSIIGLFIVGEVVIMTRLFIKKRKNDNI